MAIFKRLHDLGLADVFVQPFWAQGENLGIPVVRTAWRL
jgi:hypothetical protein